MQFYAHPGKPEHQKNIDIFKQIVRAAPGLNLYFPNFKSAPWHVQAKMVSVDNEAIVLNFWPHVLKANREGEHAVTGYEAIMNLIDEAFYDMQTSISLIEEIE